MDNYESVKEEINELGRTLAEAKEASSEQGTWNPDRHMAIYSLMATAQEISSEYQAPSYVDEKMSKAVGDMCRLDNLKNSTMCKGKAHEWAKKERD